MSRFYLTGKSSDHGKPCKRGQHVPRWFADGAECRNCGAPISERAYRAWEKKNPAKTFHKVYRNIGYGGVETMESFAKRYGTELREPPGAK